MSRKVTEGKKVVQHCDQITLMSRTFVMSEEVSTKLSEAKEGCSPTLLAPSINRPSLSRPPLKLRRAVSVAGPSREPPKQETAVSKTSFKRPGTNAIKLYVRNFRNKLLCLPNLLRKLVNYGQKSFITFTQESRSRDRLTPKNFVPAQSCRRWRKASPRGSAASPTCQT